MARKVELHQRALDSCQGGRRWPDESLRGRMKPSSPSNMDNSAGPGTRPARRSAGNSPEYKKACNGGVGVFASCSLVAGRQVGKRRRVNRRLLTLAATAPCGRFKPGCATGQAPARSPCTLR